MKSGYFNLKNNLIITLLFSVTSIVTAQKLENPSTIYDLGANINEMTLTIGGVLVVATNEGLVGIKPTQKEPAFSFKTFGKLKPEETKYIPTSHTL